MDGFGGGRPPWRLREVREATGLAQPELAALAGVGGATVYRVERGRSAPTPRVARRLAGALGLPVAAVAELAPADGAPVVARVRHRHRHPAV